MMKTKAKNDIKLGVLVLTGIAMLLLGLYYVGMNKNIFQSKILLQAHFNSISGLLPGNNVRLNGFLIGTVEEIQPISDQLIAVSFSVKTEHANFINKKALVSIGSEGLLGNKIIEITTSKEAASPVTNGTVLKALNPVDMENNMQLLNRTNENINTITINLREISEKISRDLLADSNVIPAIKLIFEEIHASTQQTFLITQDLQKIIQGVKNGKGLLGLLTTDNVLTSNIHQITSKIDQMIDTLQQSSTNIYSITKKIDSGQGTVGKVINDTILLSKIVQSLKEIDKASKSFQVNMEALQHNFLLRKYFKDK